MSLRFYSKFFILISSVLLVLSGCASDSYHPQTTSVLDGSWRTVSMGCATGKPTAAEVRTNEALKSRQLTSRITISNGMGHTEITTRQAPPVDRASEDNGSYCKLTMEQRWSVIGSHIEVTDEKISEQGYNGNRCQGTHQLHDPRVHNYVLRGNHLTVYMNSGLTVNAQGDESTIVPSQCDGGAPQSVVFERE